MPKLKTKSGAKKRFKVLKSGCVKVSQSGKRHGMRHRSKRNIREQRGFVVLDSNDAKALLVKRFMPYS